MDDLTSPTTDEGVDSPEGEFDDAAERSYKDNDTASDNEGDDPESIEDTKGDKFENNFEKILKELGHDPDSFMTDKGRREFSQKYGDYLHGQTKKENKTLLHMLAEARWSPEESKAVRKPLKWLISQLIEKYPSHIDRKDGENNTPLYLAINTRSLRNPRWNARLVSWMCQFCCLGKNESYNHFQKALGMTYGRQENCVHAAFRVKLPPVHVKWASGHEAMEDIILQLIKHAEPETLCAKNSDGLTPLHLAVEYGGSAMDEFTPSSLSVYEYHMQTCELAQNKQPSVQKSVTKAKGKSRVSKDERKPGLRVSQPITKEANSGSRSDAQKRPGEDKPGDALQRMKNGNKDGDKEEFSSKRNSLPTVPGFQLSRAQTGLSKEQLQRNEPAPKSIDAADPKQQRKEQPGPSVTEESLKKIRNEIKLHYMRTKGPADVIRYLYGKNLDDTQIAFDHFGAPPEVSVKQFEASLKHVKFDEFLQYVAYTSVKVDPPPLLSDNPPGKTGKGRTDMVFFSKWLRSKGVKRIIKVIVHDLQEPAHSDQAIEEALTGFNVEKLDWQKIDLCPETIYNACTELTEVHLQWSGSNAVLRAWSEREGLAKLKKLKTIYIQARQGLESSNRTNNNLEAFCERLRAIRNDIKIEIEHVHDERIPFNRNPDSATPPRNGHEPPLHPHKWLECMDVFANVIQNVWGKTSKQQAMPSKLVPVQVALIDDGVDIYSHRTLQGKIIGGKSFDFVDPTSNRVGSYYISSRGHGTVMADLICRVCPVAALYVIRLETRISEEPKPQISIVSSSAAKAIDAAVDKGVAIICMSWSMEPPEEGADRKAFNVAMQRAIDAGILIFCAASDAGAHRDEHYPAAYNRAKVFKIGAARASGDVWEWSGLIDDLDFILPGHEVIEESSGGRGLAISDFNPHTGSSVANALAVGLAALIISCVTLGALHTELYSTGTTRQPIATAVTEDIRYVKKHPNMKDAFQAIGTNDKNKGKFVEVWNVFDRVEQLKATDPDMSLYKMAGLARNLVHSR